MLIQADFDTIRLLKIRTRTDSKNIPRLRTQRGAKGKKMKKEIHPTSVECKVSCACGNEFVTKSKINEVMTILKLEFFIYIIHNVINITLHQVFC